MKFSFNGRKIVVTGLLCSLVLVAVLSACGGSSGTGTTPSQPSANAGPVQEVRMDMGDFFYKPNDITVKAGTIKFILTNVGATAHRLSIKNMNNLDVTVASSKNVGAGLEGSLEVTLQPGTYKMGCPLGDHEARGSVGKLTVQ